MEKLHCIFLSLISLSLVFFSGCIHQNEVDTENGFTEDIENADIDIINGPYKNEITFQNKTNNSAIVVSEWLSESFDVEIISNYTRPMNNYSSYHYNCSKNLKIDIGYNNGTAFHKADIYVHNFNIHSLEHSFPEDEIIEITKNIVENLSLNMNAYNYRLEKETTYNSNTYCYRVYVSPIFHLNEHQFTEIGDIGMVFAFNSDNGGFGACTIYQMIESFDDIHPYISKADANQIARDHTDINSDFTLSKLIIRNRHICYLMEIDVGGQFVGITHRVFIDIQNGNVEGWETEEYFWG